MRVKIELPYPDAGLSPNARLNRWEKATLTYSARVDASTIAGYWTGCADLPDGENIPIRLTFCPPDARGRDLDNAFASMKAALDGVAQALGVNDKLFHPVTLDWGHQYKNGRVILEINL